MGQNCCYSAKDVDASDLRSSQAGRSKRRNGESSVIENAFRRQPESKSCKYLAILVARL